MLVTGLNSTEVFSSENEGKSWKRRESGWLLRSITPDNGRLVAATAFDGVVIEQPSAVAAGESASSAAAGVR